MAGNTWKAPEKRQTEKPAQDTRYVKNSGKAPPGRAVLLQALLDGVSPDYLPGLMAKYGTGLPNSLMLDLLSRQSTFAETPFPRLPETPPETEAFSWTGDLSEPDGAAALPAPLAPLSADAAISAESAAPVSAPVGASTVGAGPVGASTVGAGPAG